MLSSGTKIGTYEITGLIGAGGMGEVYRAHDGKLGRDVAIKVLPEQFARDGERLARFQREAKMLAALNHPNIAAIYGLEESGNTHYLVMELVEGPTLAEKIVAGAIPLDEALPIARQLSDAIEYAHDKNVIHRDLKPANIKVKEDGTVKVLDFGLAKAMAEEAAESDMSNSPTLSMAATRQGVILGTAAYMSPEQAKGKTADRRADVWAFGCVLYEMLTGKQTFQGEDITEVLAAVVMKEPALNALPSKTPLAIRNLVRRCLEKNLRRRLGHISEARIVLEDVVSGPSVAEEQTAGNQTSPIRRLAFPGFVALSVVLSLALAGLALVHFRETPAAQPVTRTVINLPPGDQLAGLDQPAVALSQDGRQLAYVATRGNVQQLYMRPIDGFEARPIAGTEGAVNPFFSPDGQWLVFFGNGKLRKILVSGGAALNLIDLGNSRGASWGSQGTIVLAPANSALQQLLDAGGASKPLTHLETGETTHRWPEFLPGGKAVLFAAGSATSSLQIAVYSPATSARRNLNLSGTHPRYAPSGHLIYVQQGTLMAVPFDAVRLEVKGTPVPVVEGVLQSTANGDAQYSISADGSLAYIPGGIQATQRKMVWVDRKGVEQPLPAPEHAYSVPRLSPDGRRVAVAVAEQGTQTWLYDLARDTLTRFTFEGDANTYPRWTPDGKRIGFRSNKEGPLSIFWQLADGSGGLERLTSGEYSRSPMSWSPDGQLLAFGEVNPTTGYDIWMLPLSDRKPQPFLRTRFNEGGPQFSPDGHWLAYISDESGRSEVYVQPYPGPGGKWQISTEGGNEPMWNHNGRELFYRDGDKMMAVEISTQPGFSAGKPRMLFQGQYLPNPPPNTFPNYDVSPDGQRFLMIKASGRDLAATQINVVLNWSEELKRRVPVGKQ